MRAYSRRRYVARRAIAFDPYWEGWLVFDREEGVYFGKDGPRAGDLNERDTFTSRVLASELADELERAAS